VNQADYSKRQQQKTNQRPPWVHWVVSRNRDT